MINRESRAVAAKKCYGHLGGKLGERLFVRLVELGWFERTEAGSTAFRVTRKGERELTKLGVSLE